MRQREISEKIPTRLIYITDGLNNITSKTYVVATNAFFDEIYYDLK